MIMNLSPFFFNFLISNYTNLVFDMKNMVKILVVIAILCVAITTHGKEIIHPTLLYTPERVAAAMQRITIDTVQAKAWAQIKAKADKMLDNGSINDLEVLALAYQGSKEKQYCNKIIEILMQAAKDGTWSYPEFLARRPAWRSELQMGHKAYNAAIGYDAVYNELTPQQREEISTNLWRLAAEPLLGDWLLDGTRIHSINSMGHNWWSICISEGALLALAISNEIPEAYPAAQLAIESMGEWWNFKGDALQGKAKTFDDNGGSYESVNYTRFGTIPPLMLRLAWLDINPDAELEPWPQMEKLTDYFCHVSYPRTGALYSLNFGDGEKTLTGEGVLMLLNALGYGSENGTWYINQVLPGQNREGYPRSTPLGFVFAPKNEIIPDSPNLPLQQLWSDMGWATMRNSWAPDATMLAVKSGDTWNHAHADNNSFILYHNGVDIIKDAGNCTYTDSMYIKYFFQCDAHNVVKVNGRGQSTFHQFNNNLLPGHLHDMVANDRIKYVLADATGPTADIFDRNFRHFLWIGNVILVIDDLRSHEPGNYEWLWHPGGTAKVNNGDLEITAGKSSVVIHPIYPLTDEPRQWELVKGPTPNLKGTEDYYSMHLPGKYDRVKAVTAIFLNDSPNPTQLPTISTRQGENWIALTLDDNGKKTDVYINQLADGRLMHLNSWIEAEGWITDAYLLAINEDDTFVCYGSQLKRGDDILFSSLTKKIGLVGE